MNCKEIRALIEEYIEGELSRERREIVERHLEDCAACRKECEELDKVMRLVSSLDEVPAPANFMQDVRARLEREQSVWQRFRLWFARPLRLSHSFGILAIIFVFLGFFVWTNLNELTKETSPGLSREVSQFSERVAFDKRYERDEAGETYSYALEKEEALSERVARKGYEGEPAEPGFLTKKAGREVNTNEYLGDALAMGEKYDEDLTLQRERSDVEGKTESSDDYADGGRYQTGADAVSSGDIAKDKQQETAELVRSNGPAKGVVDSKELGAFGGAVTSLDPSNEEAETGTSRTTKLNGRQVAVVEEELEAAVDSEKTEETDRLTGGGEGVRSEEKQITVGATVESVGRGKDTTASGPDLANADTLTDEVSLAETGRVTESREEAVGELREDKKSLTTATAGGLGIHDMGSVRTGGKEQEDASRETIPVAGTVRMVVEDYTSDIQAIDAVVKKEGGELLVYRQTEQDHGQDEKKPVSFIVLIDERRLDAVHKRLVSYDESRENAKLRARSKVSSRAVSRSVQAPDVVTLYLVINKRGPAGEDE